MQESNGTSGHQEAKPLLRQKNKDEVRKKKIGRPKDLPTQDELLSDQSAEALLRPDKVKKKAAKVGS